MGRARDLSTAIRHFELALEDSKMEQHFRPSQYDLDMIIKLAEKQKKELPDAVRTYVPPAQDDDGRDLDEVDSGKERPSKVQRRSREGRGSGAPSRSGGVQRSG